jgi:fructose-1,6-bisphosphatase-3
MEERNMHNDKYLRLLAKDYPNIRLVKGEILRLQALLELPKGTEYFFSDLHGEDGAFIHLMRSASGNIRTKIRELYGNMMTEIEQNQLANLIYDPLKVINLVRSAERDTGEWTRITIIRLSELCRYTSSKYSREHVAAKMPPEYAPVLNELLYSGSGDFDRNAYYNKIIAYIIEDCSGDDFIVALCEMIQKICVNHLHIIGDIFDRGKGPHTIMEELIDFDKVDIQWGNHDIVWMGAASGNEACMCSVLKNGISYNSFDALEDGYSLNLRALSNFAQDVYGNDPCERFMPKLLDQNIYDKVDVSLAAKMHKAIAVIMFKLEGQLIERHPEYGMDDRNVLKMIDFRKMTFISGNKEYPLLDRNFPTIDTADPLKLTTQEAELMKVIKASFLHSEPLHRHISFLYSHGSSYKCVNNNLLFHGCMPMTEDGKFDGIEIGDKMLTGRSLMDYIAVQMTQAYYKRDNSKRSRDAADFMWYLWCGSKSPMYGKSKMATFENYFINDKLERKEIYNPYYKLSEEESVCDRIFIEFGMDPKASHIINGHVPVKIKDGETPVKAGGKLFVIDGGISKAYQPKTGIAGYTLIFNSHHLALAEHHSFDQIENDMGSYTPKIQVVDVMPHRLRTEDTDAGDEIREKIVDLTALIEAYQKGVIKEKQTR